MARRASSSEGKPAKSNSEIVEELLEICIQRGISRHHLSDEVHQTSTRWFSDGDPIKELYAKNAAAITAAGVAAQIHYLLQAWGETRLRRKLNSAGGVLDAIMKSTSSTSLEIEEELGRHNVDEDGDVSPSGQ